MECLSSLDNLTSFNAGTLLGSMHLLPASVTTMALRRTSFVIMPQAFRHLSFDT